MENKSQTKLVFSNLQDMLANMPERERYEFLKHLEKHEIIGNSTLEPLFLFQYNAALFIDTTLAQVQKKMDSASLSLEQQQEVMRALMQEFKDNLEHITNLSVEKIQKNIGDQNKSADERARQIHISLINAVESFSAFMDTTFEKLETLHANKEFEKMNALNAFSEALEKKHASAISEIENKIDLLSIQMGSKLIPDALKESVKAPVANYLNRYLKMTKKESDTWSPPKLLRDFVLYGGTILLFKFLHLI